MISRFRAFLKEPLIQFFVIGSIFFALYALVNPEQSGEQDIRVSEGRILNLQQQFIKTWNRAPNPQELKTLVDGFVLEEIYYREALKLNLEANDPVIRRRLRLKMESLSQSMAVLQMPTDTQLQQQLESDPAQYQIPARVSFEQYFFSLDNRSSAQAALSLTQAQQQLAQGLTPVTDDTPLAFQMSDESCFNVDRHFGRDFCQRLQAQPLQQWSGPVSSGLGLHLVKLIHVAPAHLPNIADIRSTLTHDWRSAQSGELAQQLENRWLDTYQIIIEWPSVAPGDDLGGKPMPAAEQASAQ